MVMAQYDYEQALGDLQSRYATDKATQDYAHFVGQQRFQRQNFDQNQSFQRGFPKFTGAYAKQLGSGVQSGVFRDKLSQNVGDFNMAQDRSSQDQAGFDANFLQNQTLGDNAYANALQILKERLAQQRLATSPFAPYVGVNG
jgi:hypothetical protein